MPASPSPPLDQRHFDLVRSEWEALDRSSDREDEFARLLEEWREVEWRSGGSTLMAALGLQFREVALCRGLAWLLDPEGGHGLGRHVLRTFLEDLGVQVADESPVAISVEESRADTRADVVLRVEQQVVVIEAKVFAGEQPTQADRLRRHWATDQLTLVYLTRTGHSPSTAETSSDVWVARRWRDVASLLRRVADSDAATPSSGAREFIETIGAL